MHNTSNSKVHYALATDTNSKEAHAVLMWSARMQVQSTQKTLTAVTRIGALL